ncbi:MAG: Sugar fermentation stimulation protein A [Alphaproteobacteria bacterium MarineAlpha2_Bin1]|nr:MAG: Sugar fermentation stimulation protein A [Alphaproteobacteria bacterium MarineAlpha2_Bin1]
MNFKSKLLKGLFIRRYKRFFADVQLENGIVTAHCPNTGSMKGLLNENDTVWLSETNNPDRKLKYTWELVKDKKTKSLVGINTQLPNKLVYDSLLNNKIEEFSIYESIRKEVRYGNKSRIDFLLESKKVNPCYLEVKNVHYSDGDGLAKFPDAITSRGLKHLHELMEVANSGYRAVMLYVVQRSDCNKFAIADDIDPEYYKGFNEALKNGVEVLCFSCKISTTSILIGDRIEIQN